MHTLLQLASAALAANDAECLEELCRRAQATPLSRDDVANYAAAMMAFQKQVNSARQNIVLRERLLHLRMGEEMQWAR